MIPFRDSAELEAGGTAAFLRLVNGRTRSERLGGLLQVNARGEPVEFTFGAVQVPGGPLWRAGDAERGGMRSLAISMFQTSQRSPLLLLCLAREIPPALFRDELQLVVPVCRLAAGDDAAKLRASDDEIDESTSQPTIHLFWRPGPPSAESPARRLVDSLAQRGLLLEPFDRIPAGLREALTDSSAE
jgi:hypothetical protein